MTLVALVSALPLAAAGLLESNLSWLKAWLSERGVAVQSVVTEDRANLGRVVASASAIVVGDLRPGSDLMVASTLVATKAALVLYGCNYSFCEIGTRVCSICSIRNRCAGSNRVAIYRDLARRADALVYLSPLHRDASETFLGAYPDKTMTLVPPRWPEVAAALTEPAPQRAMAHANRNDPQEIAALVSWAAGNGDWQLDLYGAPPPTEAASGDPTNLRRLAAVSPTELAALVGDYPARVALPARPMPFAAAAAAFDAAPRRRLFGNDNLGYRSYQRPIAELVARRDADGARLGEAVFALATQRRAPTASAPPVAFARPLLWAHNLGLGDSINLLPFARALEAVTEPGALGWVMPSRHKSLLDGESEAAASAPSHESFDLAEARTTRDLIVEVAIRDDDLCAEDILEERWVRVALARSPNAFQSVHENLLSLLGRAGVAAMPGPPTIEPSEAERQQARERFAGAGLDATSDLIVSVHPGAGARIKCWSPEKFAALCQAIEDRGGRVVLIGGLGENDIIDRITEMAPRLAWVGRELPLREVAALIELATAHIGNDSGLTHLAGAVGTPSVAIFGPSEPRIWGPTSPVSQVVVPVGPGGRRVWDLRRLSVGRVLTAARVVLHRAAREIPRRREQRLVAAARTDAARPIQTLAAVISIDEPSAEEAATGLLERARAPIAYAELAETTEPELLAFAIATGLLLPPWARGPAIMAWLGGA